MGKADGWIFKGRSARSLTRSYYRMWAVIDKEKSLQSRVALQMVNKYSLESAEGGASEIP